MCTYIYVLVEQTNDGATQAVSELLLGLFTESALKAELSKIFNRELDTYKATSEEWVKLAKFVAIDDYYSAEVLRMVIRRRWESNNLDCSGITHEGYLWRKKKLNSAISEQT